MRTLAGASLLACLVWTLCFAVGFAGAASRPAGDPRPASENRADWARERFGEERGEVFRAVASNNLRVLAINLAGAGTFGLSTFSIQATNGLFLGYFIRAQMREGLGLASVLRLTLPHAIELLGFWLAGGVGFTGALLVFDRLRNAARARARPIALCAVALASAGVIVLAAWIEVYVTLRGVLL